MGLAHVFVKTPMCQAWGVGTAGTIMCGKQSPCPRWDGSGILAFVSVSSALDRRWDVSLDGLAQSKARYPAARIFMLAFKNIEVLPLVEGEKWSISF